MIDKIRDFAKPIPIVREQLLVDSILSSYSKTLNQLHPDLFVEEGRKRYAAGTDTHYSGLSDISVMLAHTVQQFTHGSPKATVEIPFTPHRSRFHYMETGDWYQAIPYFCHQLFAKLVEAAKVHDEYKPVLDGSFMNWSQITHVGHPIQFLHRHFNFPSLLFDKQLYTSSDGTVCHGQAFFAPSIGGEKIWVRFRKSKLAGLLPGLSMEKFVTAQLMRVPGGTRLFAFLHKGNEEESRLYIASLAQLEEGSYILMDEQQKRLEEDRSKGTAGGFVRFAPNATKCTCPMCELEAERLAAKATDTSGTPSTKDEKLDESYNRIKRITEASKP